MLSFMNVRTLGRPSKSPIRHQRIKGVGSTFRTRRLRRSHRMAKVLREVLAESRLTAMERSLDMIGSLRRQIETAAVALRPGIRLFRAKNHKSLLLLAIAFRWIPSRRGCKKRATQGPSLEGTMAVAWSHSPTTQEIRSHPASSSLKIRPTVPCVVSLRLQSIGITRQACCTTKRAPWIISLSSPLTRRVEMERTSGRTTKARRASRHSYTTLTLRASMLPTAFCTSFPRRMKICSSWISIEAHTSAKSSERRVST
mmetsp:Transcript_11130/g.31351  ORF Transcript_11130/g.31351 Transcript_11130/m.31351 type:complete len:256 (-) Transcript_11130:193-960(-)